MMNKKLGWLFLISFGLVLVWMVYKEIQSAIASGRLLQSILSWAFALFGMIVFLGGYVVIFLLRDAWRQHIRKQRYQLPPGVTMKMVLDESPYELAHFQGEDDYRVYDKQKGEPIGITDPDGAEAWIIKQYLIQRNSQSSHKTP